ncbi:MAG: PTS sugar transporter subunit IIA [Candidatus Desantisbacteria bacterium]
MDLDVPAVADLFGVSKNKVYHWIKQKEIPVVSIQGQHRFNRSDLIEWAIAKGIKFSPMPEVLPQSSQPPHTCLPSLAAALEKGGIFYHIKGDYLQSVLQSVVYLLPLPDDIDREFLLTLLLARESLGSTGVGNGIAIPHPRNPIISNVSSSPTITLCFLEKPIDFGALDGQPVHALFILISNTVPIHLHLLSQIASTLNNPEFKALILSHAKKEDILSTAQQLEGR